MSNPPTYEHAQLETVQRHLDTAKAQNVQLSDENKSVKAKLATSEVSFAALKKSERKLEKRVKELEDEAKASTKRKRDMPSTDDARGSSSRSTTGGRRELPSFPVVRPRTIASSTSTAVARPSSSTSVPTPASSSASAIIHRQPLGASNAQSSADVAPPLIDPKLMARRAAVLLSPASVKRLIFLIDWHDRAITDLDAAEIRGRIAELFERESMGDRPYSEWTRLWDERDTLKKEVRAALEMKRGQSAGPSRGRR